MISGWFLDAPFEELRKEDLEMFVAWMLLQKDAEAVRLFGWIRLAGWCLLQFLVCHNHRHTQTRPIPQPP